MPLVLVISSYVAGSRVGGGVAPFVLGPMKVDPILIPTTLLGRHPGWGKPGGGPTPVEAMRGMLEGIEANGLLEMVDIVLTGYMATPEQAAFAGWAIDEIRSARPAQEEGGDADGPLVIVDAILGDEGTGYYVPPKVAQAINLELVPRADIIACNRWEFAELRNKPLAELATPEAIRAEVQRSAGAWLVSSVADGPESTGALYADFFHAFLATTPRVSGTIPKGTGDLLKLRFVGGLANGLSKSDALAQAVGATHAVIDKAVEWRAPELPLAACWPLLADPPRANLRAL